MDLASASFAPGTTYVQLSDFSLEELSLSAREATWDPTLNAIKTTCTAMGRSVESEGLEAIAVAANRPVQRPDRYVFSGVVASSCSFSKRLVGGG
jgi:hypothetical protein